MTIGTLRSISITVLVPDSASSPTLYVTFSPSACITGRRAVITTSSRLSESPHKGIVPRSYSCSAFSRLTLDRYFLIPVNETSTLYLPGFFCPIRKFPSASETAITAVDAESAGMYVMILAPGKAEASVASTTCPFITRLPAKAKTGEAATVANRICFIIFSVIKNLSIFMSRSPFRELPMQRYVFIK